MRQLSCRRGGHILFEDLHCCLQPGQCLVLRGANGSGKSTLLRIAAGLYRDFEGEIHRSPMPALYLGHTAGLKDALSVRENLHWLSALYAVPASGAEAVLEQLGLEAERPVAELSAGQRQRTALARLLLIHSPLWLLDEPFAALDQQGTQMLHRMLAVHTARGGGALIAAHRAAPREQPSGLCLEPFLPAEAEHLSQPLSPVPASESAWGGDPPAIGNAAGGPARTRDVPEGERSSAPGNATGGLVGTRDMPEGERSSALGNATGRLVGTRDMPKGERSSAPGNATGGLVSTRDIPKGERSSAPGNAVGQGGAFPTLAPVSDAGGFLQSPSGGSAMGVFCAALRRDFLLLFRERGALLRPPLFLLAATLLIPLGQGPLPADWGGAAGLIWAFAFLAMLLAADTLCRDDLQDGSLDQILVAPSPPWAIALARVLLCWFSVGVMVAFAAPIAGLLLNLPGAALPVLVAGLLLGGIPLAALGAVGAALCAGVRSGGLLMPLILLPLALPVLVFGASASAAAAEGFSPWPALALLGALSLLALALLPLAVSTGWRISVEI